MCLRRVKHYDYVHKLGDWAGYEHSRLVFSLDQSRSYV